MDAVLDELEECVSGNREAVGDERTDRGDQSVSAEAAGGETMHVCPAVLVCRQYR